MGRLARIICSLAAVAVGLSLATALGATGGAAGSAVKSPDAAKPAASKAGKPGPRGPRGRPGPAGPAGPSDAYVRGFPTDRFGLPNGAVFVPVAEVVIPKPGGYVIWAKAYVTGDNAVVTCQLIAGSDTDQSMVSAAAGAPGSNGYPGTISNLVAHQYTSPGVADLKCALNNGTAALNNVQVAAIRVGNLTQVEGQTP